MIHIVCRGCTFEKLVEDADEARRLADEHEAETGHTVAVGEVDDV